MNGNSDDFGLYIHIPFCTKKCGYCHFYVIPEKEAWKERLTEVLLRHGQQELATKTGNIRTLYFGGGTPALMGPERLHRLMEGFRSRLAADAEITLEANPENLSEEDLKGFKDAGINRLSLGVQTLDEELLPKLGRTHTAAEAVQAIERATPYFDNISIDLMYDLPDQSVNSWAKTLATAAVLPITHLSLYNLTIEPHTSFYKRRHQLQLPTPTASAEMYDMAVTTLGAHHLKQYEISAFCKEGYRSRHNLGYWLGIPFLGLGPSAYSYVDGRRFRCHTHFHRYCEAIEQGSSPIDFEEMLDSAASSRERLVIALRIVEGVKMEKVEVFGAETKKEVAELVEQGLLEIENQYLKMTEKGIRFYDTIAAALI